MAILKTKQDKDLQKKWYAKLKRSGFADIESDEDNLKVSTLRQFVMDYRKEVSENKEEYYRMAGHFLHDHKFETPVEKTIWRLHSDGISIMDIVFYLKSKKVKTYKRKVHETIQKLCEEMGAKCRSKKPA